MADAVVGFDFDLTLVDPRAGSRATLAALSAETGVLIDADLVVSRLGPPLEVELANWFPAADVDRMADRYREIFAEIGVSQTVALAGAAEALSALAEAGTKVAVITAKSEPLTWATLRHLGLHADVVFGWRWGPGKVDALRECGALAYVGDHVTDIAAACEAGVMSIGVTSGAHDRAALLAAGADVVLDSLSELRTFTEWRSTAGSGGESPLGGPS